MVLHLGIVQLVEQECGALFDNDGVIPPVERLGGLKRQAVLDLAHGEQVASDEDELQEDLAELVVVRVDDLIFLEGLELAHGGARDVTLLVVTGVVPEARLTATFVVNGGSVPLDKFHAVGVDDAVVLGLDAEIVGYKFDWTLVRCGGSGLAGAAEPAPATTTATIALVLVPSAAVAVVLVIIVVLKILPMHDDRFNYYKYQ